MGAPIRINDTLKLKCGAGFPADPLVIGKRYKFEIGGIRLYNLYPSRVFLVEEIDGKWNYRGHGKIMSQTINAETQMTSGTFELSKIYDDAYRKRANFYEARDGMGYDL